MKPEPGASPPLFFGKPWPIVSPTAAMKASRNPHMPDFQGPFLLQKITGRPVEPWLVFIEPEGDDCTDSTHLSEEGVKKKLVASGRAGDPVIAHCEPTGFLVWVSFQMDGKQFHGWLACYPFQPGDELEVIAAHEKDDVYRIYALARPADRLIVLHPYCPPTGRLAWIAKSIPVIVAAMALATCIPAGFFALLEGMETGFATARVMLIILAVLFPLIAYSWFRSLAPYAFAERVFRAMGFAEAKRINLMTPTRRTPLDGTASRIMTEQERCTLPVYPRHAVTTEGYGRDYFRY